MKVFVSVPKNDGVMETFFPENVKKYLEERFEVTYLPKDDEFPTIEEFKEYAKDADIVMTGWCHPVIDAKMLEGTNIKMIAHTGGSVGSLVVPETYDKGVKVISGNIYYARSVAEGTVGYILAGLRKIPDYVNCVRYGGWQPEQYPSERLIDQTVGIVGLGAISRNLIKMLQVFDVKIKIYSNYPIDENYLKENNATQVSLEEIFSTCKIVSLHSAMNERTRGMIRKEHFDMLQDGALFINTARGRVIVEEDLIAALKEDRFRAVLDVYYKEPLPADSDLRKLHNVYCMPHVGGPTMDFYEVITKYLIDDMVKFEKGESVDTEITREYAARMTVGG
ncbi:MAG: hydroxyacid dehydrogenase [Clostridia bacterium]|nr:hydroxyacid dehydrogenase [Clostridia bacterium]